MTTVSVVVPTRNRSRLLATTLHSVLWQRDVDLEAIVVDEASTDDTEAVVAGFADERITLLRHEAPKGLSAARNTGAAGAGGDWVAFVDDDDVWAPDKLASQVAAGKSTERAWVYTGTVNIGGLLEPLSGAPPPAPEDVMAALPRYNPIPGGGSNVILRRASFLEAGGFDERFTMCADWELWARLARVGPPASVPRPLVGYRVHAANMSLDTDLVEQETRLIEELHGAPIDWGRVHRWLAESSLRTGDRPAALRFFASAAMRGQAGGVAGDLATIVRRKVARRSGARARDDDGWIGKASEWLAALRLPSE